jgi:hypothetical protein
VNESDDVTVQLNLDTRDPTVLRDLFEAYGLNFIVRSQEDAASLFGALGAGFIGMLTPASGFHFICGPADQRCIVQILDLGDETMVAAVCTGEGEVSNQSMLWVTERIVKPMELAARVTGGRWGIISSGHYGAEDAHLAERIPLARVVPIAALEVSRGDSEAWREAETQHESPEEVAHRNLWHNVQSLREALRTLAEEERRSGDNDGSQARLLIESKLAEIPRGSSLDALWNDLELLYRQTIAVVAELTRQGQQQAALGFVGSAGMLLGLLRPDLSEDERNDQLIASLDKQVKEQAAQNAGALRPTLALSATDVDFGSLSLGAESPRRSVLMRNTGGGELKAEVGPTPDWLIVRRLDEVIDLLVDTSQPGDFVTAVPVRSAGGNAAIRVRAHVMPGPVLDVEPASVLLAPGAAETRLVRINNRGSGILEWQYSATGDFFSAERVAEGLRVVLRAAAGQQHGSIWVRSNGGEVTLDVRATAPASATERVYPPARKSPAQATRRRHQLALMAVFSVALLVVGLVVLLAGGRTAATPAPAQPLPKTTLGASPPSTNAAPPPTTTLPPPRAVPPDQIVRNYYDAINSHDYQTAWRLVGGNKFGQTYQEFVAGFASTAHDKLRIDGVNGNTVTIELVATQDDRTTRTYQGTYTIQGGRIVDASLQRVG